MNYNLESLEYCNVLEILAKYTSTNYAKILIAELKPEHDFEIVKNMLNETKNAYDTTIRFGEVPLGGLVEIKDALMRSKIDGLLEAIELLNITQLINTTSNVLKYQKLLLAQKINIDNLNLYFSNLIIHDKLKKSITLTIDDNGKIFDNATQKLFTIRQNLNSTQNRLRAKMNELLQSKANMLNESLIVYRNDRMCLPVKAEYKNTFKGIIHDESASHTTVYIEPAACLEINANIQSLLTEEKKEVENILRSLSLLVSVDSEELLNNLENLARLDIIYAKAKYAIAEDLIMPDINDQGIIDLKRAKHPLITKEKVVPIDISIGKDFQTIIITGPNTGGKTVALKTVGLLTCLMQTGLFVPCKEHSKLAVFDNVFVDIGDEQSIEQSLSTFSSHMTKLIKIIDNLTINSLVLLDELGSGTDPKEGSSLAISIIEHLKARGARIIVTTHYTDLKAYAYDNADICNASVEFNIETLAPTYKLLMGIPGKSNAIEIAKRLGLDNRIIDNAKIRLKENSDDAQALMERLDDESSKISHIKVTLEHKISEYNQKIREVDEVKSNLQKENDKIISKARLEAHKIVEDAKDNIDSLLSEIDELRKRTNFKEHELADLKYLARNLTPMLEENTLFNHQYQVGDHVFIKSYDQNGIISKIKKDKYEVNVGNFTMMFTKEEILPATKTIIKKEPRKRPVGTNPVSNADFRCDLRGLRYEEVKDSLDKFIDQAYLANVSMVQIIHGFGTGALRNAVNEYLKSSAYIKSYRYGVEGEGLNGVTVVYLK